MLEKQVKSEKNGNSKVMILSIFAQQTIFSEIEKRINIMDK